MSAPTDWEVLEPFIKPLRDQKLNVDAIADKLGVSVEAFRNFRRRTGYKIAPIHRSKRTLIGRTEADA
jgi:hypothetical protein